VMSNEHTPLLVAVATPAQPSWLLSHGIKGRFWATTAATTVVMVSLLGAMIWCNLVYSFLAPSTSGRISPALPTIAAPATDSFLNLHESAPELEVVFVLGGPGAGKGTQCENIVRYYKWVHLSMGDLLRAEVQKGGALSQVISDCMKNGKLVPGELTVELLKQEMARQATIGNTRFLIDGFPRNRENLVDWEKLIGPVDRVINGTAVAPKHHAIRAFAHVKFVLFFDCPEATMLARCLHRGETSGRVDDNEEAVKKRFVTYNEETKPILEGFNEWGIVKTISAVPSAEEVFATIRPLFAGSERAHPLPAPPAAPGIATFSAWAHGYSDSMHSSFHGCPNVRV